MMNRVATEPQRYAARMAATGIPPKTIAERLGTEEKEVKRWLRLEQVSSLRDEFAAKVEDCLEDDLIGATAEMLDLWRQWLRGEVNGNDDRIKVIAPTLLRWTERYFAIAETESVGPRTSGPTIQILNAPGTPSPRLRGIPVKDDEDLLDEVRNLPPPRANRIRRQVPAGGDPVPSV